MESHATALVFLSPLQSASGWQHDGGNLAAIVSFVAVRGAAEAVKALLIAIGAQAQIDDLADALAGNATLEIGRQVEHLVAGPHRRRKKIGIVRGFGNKLGGEIWADFISLLRDRRTDDGCDALASRPIFFHDGNGRITDPGKGALPAGMRSADDAPFRIGEENGRAIGSEDGNGETGSCRDDGITLGRLQHVPRSVGNDNVGAVPLPRGEQLVVHDPEPFADFGAIPRDRRLVVTRSEAAIERSEKPFGMAALASEEAMPNGSCGFAFWRFDHGVPKGSGVASPGDRAAMTL